MGENDSLMVVNEIKVEVLANIGGIVEGICREIIGFSIIALPIYTSIGVDSVGCER